MFVLLNLDLGPGDGSVGDDSGGSWLGRAKGTVKRLLGAATADRGAEAAGAAEEKAAGSPSSDDVDEAQQAVEEKYDETADPRTRPDMPKGVDPRR